MNPAPAAVSAPNLAYCFQEILTVAARLGASKLNVGDPTAFRGQVRRAVQEAESSAQALGTLAEDARLASFAAIALLDEIILNSANPAFRDWAQRPLMLDLFGTLNAGETFFEYLSAILKRRENKPSSDLLEVYLLCLMLGFRGRFNSGSGQQLQAWREPIVEKILRQRGISDPVELSHAWFPEGNIDLAAPSNRMTRLALSCAVAFCGACLVLLLVYTLLLTRGISQLTALAHA
ncbi:MAG: DotU family type IV/VI secretion system protein [Bryobacteraceae bacterium]|nr:DotU family type IV/VI secretion system protein [Bryobacteraceae bacterium]